MTTPDPALPMDTTDAAPALLVPIDVSAMVVTGRSRNFQRWSMVYDNLASGDSPEPAPFEQVNDAFSRNPDNLGVYLAWTLPDALRRGAHDQDTGDVVFPPVPNRWLVVRVHGDPDARQTAAWVVESDYVWPDDAVTNGTPEGDPARSAAFLDPTPGLKAPLRTRLGRKVAVGAQGWTEPGHRAGWLTAVGPGNVTFSAFQPHNPNVFSLHDELYERKVPNGVLSYFVAGWYSRREDDPLFGGDAAPDVTTLLARLAELGWSACREALAGALPGRTVFHGMSAAVPWKAEVKAEAEADLAPGLPRPGTVRLAVGNTAVDALAALVDDARAPGVAPGTLARLLEAVHYDLIALLDQPDGDVRLERALRDAWFGSRPSGSRWEIAAADPRPGDPPAPSPPPAQLAAEAALLQPLNAAQAALDEARQRLASLQAELYEIWWKSVRAPVVTDAPGRYPAGTTPEQFAAALTGAGAESRPAGVAAAMDEVDRLQRDLQRAAQAAEAGKGSGRVLKEVADARFWMPGDPVVLLCGAKQEGTLPPRAVRACRTPDQLVAGLHITASGRDEAAVAVDAAPVPAPALSGMPPEVGALFREFALLDPVNAPALARAALGSGDDAVVQAVRAAVLDPHPTAGLLPDYDLGEWRAPWLPLFLEWKVRWYPVPVGSGALWRYDGHDYDRTEADPPPQTDTPIRGRAILTPRTAESIRGRLRQLSGDGSDAAGVRTLEELVAGATAGWDLLSQSLTGLHDQLALRDPGASLAPDGPPGSPGRAIAELVGAGRHSVPQSLQVSGSRFGQAASAFEGVRAGQFVFTTLSVVDRFGQTIEVVTQEHAPAFVPVRARGLTPARSAVPPAAGVPVQLPPRLLQPARLTFDFLTTDDRPAWNAAATPVCGWLVPNHLDHALSVYDGAGVVLGELRTAAGPGGRPVPVWDPAPGTGTPETVPALSAAYPHLGDAVAALAAAGAEELTRFLEAVDETLWSVDPLGERSDLLLNALVGRPLAVIRAAVGVQIQGAPVSDPSWPFTFAPRRAPFTGYAWEVELGDAYDRRDGLIGYWAEGYGRFSTVHALPGAPADGYLRPIGAGNRLAASVDGGPVRATLLMDPRGTVSARCGLLPTRDIVLPPGFVEGPLRAMQATFRAGPLLTVLRPPAPAADGDGAPATPPNAAPAAMPCPVPATRAGAWEWIEPGVEGPPLVRPVVAVDARAELPELPASLREGYLRLTPSPDPASAG